MDAAPDKKERYPVYLSPEVGRALRQEKAATRQSHSEIVERALRESLMRGRTRRRKQPA